MSKIYVAIDDEKIEATGKVLEQILADQKAEEQAKAEMEQTKQARAALLKRLNITEDEAKLLLS